MRLLQGTERSDTCADACAELNPHPGSDWADLNAEGRAQLVTHLKGCDDCRERALRSDPLWVFRLALGDSGLGEAEGRIREWPARQGAGAACGADEALDVRQLQQQVRGAIRARAHERSKASTPVAALPAAEAPLRRWLSAAGLLLAGTLAIAIGPRAADPLVVAHDGARAEVRRHLDALPVLDSDSWFALEESRQVATATSAPSALAPSATSSSGRSQLLAQLSDVEADVVWVVNSSLEL